VYSAVTADPPPAAQKVLFYKQMIWFALGFFVMAASFSFNYRVLDRWAHPIYIACVLLLLGWVVFGKLAGGLPALARSGAASPPAFRADQDRHRPGAGQVFFERL